MTDPADVTQWQNLARFAERQWQFYEAAYRALVTDLLHNQDHPAGPQRPIDLQAALRNFMGPGPSSEPEFDGTPTTHNPSE